MPIIPPVIPGIYDSCFTFLNAARLRMGQLMPSLYPTSGSILDQTQAGTQQAFNNAYRRLQDALVDAGADRFKGQIVIEDVPAVTNFDPASLCYISWFECFDGNNLQSTPVLPSDLILPLWMSERPAGSEAPFGNADTPNMRMCVDGLSSWGKQQRNGVWEWRDDKIFYPGATVDVDFKIGYRLYLSDIDNVGNSRWFNQAVPIARCLDQLTWFLCAEFATAESARNPESSVLRSLAVMCKSEAMASTKLLVNRDVMKNERADVRRIPYGARGRY